MRAYGHNRYGFDSCRYGCCGRDRGVGVLKVQNVRKSKDRKARKHARRQGKKACQNVD
jgi:hypothetical protein